MTSLTVLVVDDHADTLAAMRKLLESVGYVVLTANTCTEARAVARAEPFDILIADLELTDGNGWDLLPHLKEKALRHFGAIALSGHAYTHHIERSLGAGYCVHLTKPTRLDAILKAIMKCRQSNDSAAANTFDRTDPTIPQPDKEN